MREIALKIAFSFLGKKYQWGGKTPMEGYDCSGFIIEILKSVGVLPSEGDWTANQLSEKWEKKEEVKEGSLIFYDWDNDGKIDHVEMVYNCEDISNILTIGATGGDISVREEKKAIQKEAYIKIRKMRENFIKIVDPFL